MMSIKQRIAKRWAKRAVKATKKWAQSPIKTQEKFLKELVKTAKNTAFGRDHDYENIKTYSDFASRVPCLLYTSPSPRDPT